MTGSREECVGGELPDAENSGVCDRTNITIKFPGDMCCYGMPTCNTRSTESNDSGAGQGQVAKVDFRGSFQTNSLFCQVSFLNGEHSDRVSSEGSNS